MTQRVYVDAEGAVVEEGDPRAARVLVGADAERALAQAGAVTPVPASAPKRRGKGGDAAES